MALFNITADSIPVYNTGFYADTNSWGCSDWIRFYEALRTKHSEEESDYIWSKYWTDGVSKFSGGNGSAPGSGYFTDVVPLDCRSLNSTFKSFLDQHENLKSAAFSGVGGIIARPISLGTTVIDAAGNIISNTASGISNFTKTLKWLVPTVLVIVVIGAIYYFGKKANIFKTA